ncbi:hypothetical protein ALQ48_200088 [Pseudomonas coronafaciens pv. zizaniae]|nr:hypothetical protein ALQ48_200088 [Pseudomonas coronafaciens pv. zizaniae]
MPYFFDLEWAPDLPTVQRKIFAIVFLKITYQGSCQLCLSYPINIFYNTYLSVPI